jgi:hypothetical protein
VASDPKIPNFDANAVRAGLRLAMQVGLPVMAEDQPTFFMPTTIAGDGANTLDQQGTPFNPAFRPTRVATRGIRVPCAVDYKDSSGHLEAMGSVFPAGVVLTLLDEDYAKIKGFEYVAIGGVKYNYQRVQKPDGLVSVGIFTVHCLSDDEG